MVKKIAMLAGVVLIGMFAVGVVIQVVDPEGTRQRRDAGKARASAPSGATMAGGLAAMDMAKAGAVKPSADQVDAIARKAATEMNVPPSERKRFVREFAHGFWVGWKTANQ